MTQRQRTPIEGIVRVANTAQLDSLIAWLKRMEVAGDADSGNITFTLGDKEGVTFFRVEDSAHVPQLALDSDGNLAVETIAAGGPMWQLGEFVEVDPATVTSKTLFAATADKTVANTTTETSIVGTGVGSATLAAGFWAAGKTARIRLWGYASSDSGKFRLRVKLGSVVILDTTSVDIAGAANSAVLIQSDMTCRATGASGSVMAQGQSLLADAPTAPFPPLTSAVTVDTTASALLDVTAQWNTASAGNTITITNVSIEALG